MVEFIQIVVNGIFTGGVYAIIGIGLSLIFGVMRIVNFAHGVFLVVGMFTTLFFFERLHVDPFLVIPLVVLVGGLLGVIVERSLLEPIARAPEHASILMTVGIGLVLSNVLLFTFGDAPQIINTRYSTSTWHLGPITFSTALTISFFLTVVVISGLALLLGRTDLGRAIRAAAQNADAAELQGINTRRVRSLVFGMGFALAALAGALLLPQLFDRPDLYAEGLYRHGVGRHGECRGRHRRRLAAGDHGIIRRGLRQQQLPRCLWARRVSAGTPPASGGTIRTKPHVAA